MATPISKKCFRERPISKGKRFSTLIAPVPVSTQLSLGLFLLWKHVLWISCSALVSCPWDYISEHFTGPQRWEKRYEGISVRFILDWRGCNSCCCSHCRFRAHSEGSVSKWLCEGSRLELIASLFQPWGTPGSGGSWVSNGVQVSWVWYPPEMGFLRAHKSILLFLLIQIELDISLGWRGGRSLNGL